MMNESNLTYEELSAAYEFCKMDDKLNAIIDFHSFDMLLNCINFIDNGFISQFRAFDKDEHVSNTTMKIEEQIRITGKKNNKLAKKYECSLLSLYIVTYVIFRFHIIFESEKKCFEKRNDDTSILLPENQFDYFRGEEDSNYLLIPSLLRDCDPGYYKPENVLKLYEAKDLDSKYSNAFEKDFYHSADNYIEFLSFMQHAESKTPLLDVTSDAKRAAVFACSSNTDTDFAIYNINTKAGQILNWDDGQSDDPFFCFSIQVLKDRITPETKLHDRYLWRQHYCELHAHFKIWTKKTNTRMAYQKGSLLIPENFTIINGIPLIDYEFLHIKKYIYPKEMKKKLLKKITHDHPEIKSSYLMNPYEYFKGKV